MKALPEDPEEFVTVREFLEPGEALLARGALESAGVECLVLNENASRIYSGALSMQLQVHKKDEADALKILDSPNDESDQELDEGTDDGD